MSEQINDKPTLTELIQRFAKVNNISIEEAEQLVGAETEEEVFKKIEKYTLKNIKEKMLPLNRAQRRALAKKQKKKNKDYTAEAIADTTKKLNYIDLIQKLRDLNEKKENENYVDEEHRSSPSEQ